MLSKNRVASGRWALVAVAATCAADLLGRFWPSWALAGGFDDDFFYYAQIARALARGHGSTFDGIHITNGYHPLWLLCLAGFWAIGDGRFFFMLVTLATGASLTAVFVLCMRSQERLRVQQRGRPVIASAVVFWSVLLMRGGMEIVLAIPLLLLLLWMWLDEKPRAASGYLQLGLVASLCVLARLDSVLLVGTLLMLSLTFESVSMADKLRRGAAFGLGLTPVWIYLAINKHFFGTWTPVSAQAKELLLHHGMHWQPLAGFVYPLSGIRLMIVLPGLAGICALVALLLRREAFPVRTRTVLWSLALFPLIHIALLCWLSDWTIWYWYFYPLVLAALGGAAAWTARYPPAPRMWTGLSAALVVLCMAHALSYHLLHPPRTSSMLLAARDIRDFAAQHPGQYAMGDRSGTAGFLLPASMIQLEGLTMDRAYLDRLRAQPPLEEVLREYRVAYYISTNAVPDGPCYRAIEPAMAGPGSARMQGRFCAPLATFAYEGKVTRIFRISATP